MLELCCTQSGISDLVTACLLKSELEMKVETGHLCCASSVTGPWSLIRARILIHVAMVGSCIYGFTSAPGALVRSWATLAVEALSNDRPCVSADITCAHPTEHDLR